MFLLNFCILLIVYYVEACVKVPNCDYIIFEAKIREVKKEHQEIKERLDMFESRLDKQTEYLVFLETQIDAIQKMLIALESKIPGFENDTSIGDVTELVPDNDINDIIDEYEDENESQCPSYSIPTDCSKFNSKYCNDNKCLIQNHLYRRGNFLVSCDDVNDGGGWTVIQRRTNGSVDFFRKWSQYQHGFGDIDGEFFIGLNKLYALTNTLKRLELFILLQDFEGKYKYAKYDGFIIGKGSEKYKLIKVGSYTGNAGDSFSQHQGLNYSTKDNDNKYNCAAAHMGAWWYKRCFWSNLNGKYYKHGMVPPGKSGISWGSFHGYNYSMKFVQMMIRPKDKKIPRDTALIAL